MKRGFVFSIDMMVALFLVSAALTTVAYIISSAENIDYGRVRLHAYGSDMLLMMYRKGMLQNQSSSSLLGNLTLYKPNNTNAILTIKYYNPDSTYTGRTKVNTSTAMPEKAISVKKGFIVTNSTSISYFGIAQLEIWYA